MPSPPRELLPELPKKQLPLSTAANDLAAAKTAAPTCVLLLFPFSLSAMVVVVNAAVGVVLLCVLLRLRLVERFVIVPAASEQYCLRL